MNGYINNDWLELINNTFSRCVNPEWLTWSLVNNMFTAVGEQTWSLVNHFSSLRITFTRLFVTRHLYKHIEMRAGTIYRYRDTYTSSRLPIVLEVVHKLQSCSQCFTVWRRQDSCTYWAVCDTKNVRFWNKCLIPEFGLLWLCFHIC